MGIPGKWATVMFWLLSTSPVTVPPVSAGPPRPRLYPEIPNLEKYGMETPDSFWENFPTHRIPDLPETSINISALERLIDECKHKLLRAEISRAYKCVEYLRNGGPAFQVKHLPSCKTKNSKQALIHGSSVTDTIASWVKKGFVAGPFLTPPLSNFRSNSILAIPQSNKTRVCINLSLPEGRSFNDNIGKFDLEKIKMASARNFGYTLIKAGRNSRFAKTDIVDAYKNIPARIQDLRYQGFCWENRFFIELRQIFGASSAVQNFDILGNTVKTLAQVKSNVPASFILRQLDDTPVVGPKDTRWCESFYNSYLDICKKINLTLADNCPSHEKAFGVSTFGKVLGINFNSNSLTWYLPEDKRLKRLTAIEGIRSSTELNLKQMQSLMGSLNFISSMCPFLNIFKFNLNKALSDLTNNQKIQMNNKMGKDLQIWTNFLSSKENWLPICHEKTDPPLASIRITTDAAGFPNNSIWTSQIGCGGICQDYDGNTIMAFQQFWPKKFITVATDSNKKRFGNKTSTLEILAILMPFLLIPKKLKNIHVSIFTDNTSCVFGLTDGYTRNDEYASIIIRGIYLICGYLGTIIHPIHCPRRSSWESNTADNLTRMSTTSALEEHLLRHLPKQEIPICLQNWFVNPTDNWDLSNQLLYHVMNKCPT